jgi:hypothetical protein
MTRYQAVVIAVAIGIAANRGVFAQDGRGLGMRGGRSSIVLLPFYRSIQVELGFDAETSQKAAALSLEYVQEMHKENTNAAVGPMAVSQLGSLKPVERAEKMREMALKRASIVKQLDGKFVPRLMQTISARQFERLRQLGWQLAGAEALGTDTSLEKALELTATQVAELVTLSDDYSRKQRDLFVTGGSPESLMDQTQKMAKERDEKAQMVLSKDQRDKYRELIGPAFDFSQVTGLRVP